ncbi:hypothetical protein EV361DRAFT_872885, partial [Lentinula raphanica]
MNVSIASTVASENPRTPESQGRVLRPRKQARPSYMEPGEGNVVRLSRRRGKVPARFRNVRGVFAYLARMLTDVPIEVVNMIFCYLDSRDLLVLSRTCKLLRSHLLTKSKTVEDIWRTARLNVEGNPPPLPEDLNEIQYAHLMFDPDCHNFIPSRPSKSYPAREFKVGYSFSLAGNHNDITIIDFKVAQQLKAQYMSLESEEDRRSWLTQKRNEHQAIGTSGKRTFKHARLCEAWYKGQQEQRTVQIVDLRAERLNAILSRLEVIGLRKDAELILEGKSNFNRSSELADLPCIKQPKELTDGSWTRIKPKLIKILTDHRTQRLAQQTYYRLREEFYDFLSHQDLRGGYPGLGDVLTDPVVEAVIWETSSEEALTSKSLRALLAGFFDRILIKWRVTKREELLVILRKARPCATAGDLYLASTVFGCAACNALLVCPQVFYHRCCYKTRAAGNQSHARMRTLNKLYDTVDQEGPWSSSSLFLHLQSSQLARRIVSGAGLDPSTATIIDLTLAQPAIECTGLQADRFPERLFLTWPAAALHESRSPASTCRFDPWDYLP